MHHLRTQKAFLAAVLIRQFNPHIHRSGNVDLVSVFIRDLDIKQAHVRSAALCPAQGIFGSGNVFVIQRGIKRLFASGNGFIAFRRQYFRNLQLCVFRNSGFRAVGGRYPVIPSIAGQYILLDDSSDNGKDRESVGLKGQLNGALCLLLRGDGDILHHGAGFPAVGKVHHLCFRRRGALLRAG